MTSHRSVKGDKVTKQLTFSVGENVVVNCDDFVKALLCASPPFVNQYN